MTQQNFTVDNGIDIVDSTSNAVITLAPNSGFLNIDTDNGGEIAMNDGAGNVGSVGIEPGAAFISIDDGGGSQIWNFDANGTLTAPGNILASNFVGAGSNVDIVAGSYDWTFVNDGNLVLPGNTFAVKYANGTTVSLGGDYGNANVADFLDSLGSNAIITTGNITGGNIITANAASVILGNAASSIKQNGSNATINLSGGVTLSPDTAASANNGVVIGGNGYLLAPNGSRNAVLNYNGASGTMGIYTVNVYGNTATAIENGGANGVGNIGANTSNRFNTVFATAGDFSGNITAANFVGNINITGNVIGTQPNVTLVAGSYSYTFDNTGILTLPTGSSGNEGGEIAFTQAANSTLSGNTVVIDQYVDQIRFFESGGNTRGAYIDLTQAADGVGTLLNNRVSARVDAGTFVTMDNLKVTVTSSGNRGLSVAAVSGSFSADVGGWYGGSGAAGGDSVNNLSVTTTPSASLFGWNFVAEGNTAQYTIFDNTNNRVYRVTMMIGPAYLNNFISIERLL